MIPTRVLGLEEGDAHVIRHAGGVVTDDEIRSLAISQHLLGSKNMRGFVYDVATGTLREGEA